MSLHLWLTALLLGGGVAAVIYRAVLWRVRGDEVAVSPDYARITTELGTFSYDRTDRKLWFEPVQGKRYPIEIGASSRLLAIPDVESALLIEALGSLIGATEFGVTDLLPQYRDYTKKVALVLDDGSRQIPLAILQQYKASDMGDSLGGNDSLRAIFSGLRIYRDVESVAEARGFEIADALRRQGLNVQ